MIRNRHNKFPFRVLNTITGLEKIICLRKSEVSVEKKSVCNVIENLVEHGIHCLPCSYINDVKNVTATAMTSYSCLSKVTEVTFGQGTKHISL